MKGKLFLSVFVLALISSLVIYAQEKSIKDLEIKVFGNCNMCKNRIEGVLKIKEVKIAKWDKKSKMLRLAFDEKKITLDSLQKRIAAVGHDTEKFKAPDDVYKKLPACCLYRDNPNTH